MIDPLLIEKVNTLKGFYSCSTESLDRTPIHNASVGGSKRSWHLGTTPGGAKAIDLIFDDPAHLLGAAKIAKSIGFTGIEVDYRNNHLHLDLRNTVPWHVVCTEHRTYTLEEYLTLHEKTV